MSSTVELKSANTGRVIDVFDTLEIELSMLSPGRSWSFELWRSGAAPDADEAIAPGQRTTAWREAAEIRLGELLVVSIDGAPQVCGYVTSAPIVDRGRGGQVIVLNGTDLAGWAMRASADPSFSARGLMLPDVLTGLFAPLGISVTVTDVASARLTQQSPVAITRRADRRVTTPGSTRRVRVELAHAAPGETVWQVAEGAVRRAGLMMWVAPTQTGTISVVVDVPAYDDSASYAFLRYYREGVQARDSNILSLTLNRSIDGVPTEVTVYGHAPRGNALPQRIAQRYATEETLAILRDVVTPLPTMPMHVSARKARATSGALAEAQRITADALAKARTAELTVKGFGQQGFLYAINTMAYVRDENTPTRNDQGTLGMLDENMLVQEVTFRRSRQGGETTKLNLGTRNAVQLSPQETA